mmetsp:Transcript_24927/g.33392  ORF Transcript_24927/g.33392 Transcript_24927/m.33392 type:complete len:99 (-) Transcript_24927:154-450(-)
MCAEASRVYGELQYASPAHDFELALLIKQWTPWDEQRQIYERVLGEAKAEGHKLRLMLLNEMHQRRQIAQIDPNAQAQAETRAEDAARRSETDVEESV